MEGLDSAAASPKMAKATTAMTLLLVLSVVSLLLGNALLGTKGDTRDFPTLALT